MYDEEYNTPSCPEEVFTGCEYEPVSGSEESVIGHETEPPREKDFVRDNGKLKNGFLNGKFTMQLAVVAVVFSVVDVSVPAKAEEAPPNEPLIVYETIECPDCNGTGWICPGNPTFGLDRGNGNGYAGCGGTGYSKCPDIWCDNGVRVCEICKGEKYVECRACNGTGEDCFACGGTGKIVCSACNGTGTQDCEFCHGTGIAKCICYDEHEICSTCHGFGTIEVEVGTGVPKTTDNTED